MSDATPAAPATSATPAALEVEEGPFRSADGTTLRFRHIAPRTRARARLLVVHGFAEHGGRYLPVLRAAAERGIDAWAVDLRGHGQAEGRRAFVNRFTDYLDDVSAFVDLAARDRSETPAFLLGHSMGGLVCTRFVEERPSGLRGLVLSSAFLEMKMKVPFWKRFAARGLSRVIPSLALPTDLDPSHLSRDPEVGRRYMADPLTLKAATARWFTEAMASQAEALSKASSIAIPVLAMHGAADPIADPEGTKRLFPLLASQDKELKLWPELRHEPFNEPEGPQVAAHALSWIEARLAR